MNLSQRLQRNITDIEDIAELVLRGLHLTAPQFSRRATDHHATDHAVTYGYEARTDPQSDLIQPPSHVFDDAAQERKDETRQKPIISINGEDVDDIGQHNRAA
jgi:hypothetical protein